MGAGVTASLDWQVLYPKGNPGLKVMSVETKMGGVPAVVWESPAKEEESAVHTLQDPLYS